ncbi:MAG: pyroglutamyl-peptidase I [Eubacteriales bacterium]|nr:pyroglutamyl-peptidase I [Eubacteriales bacterium]MDY5347452.1 pyroglutamyl-peptidase I [Eubacteriales bacterium]
MILFTGFEPFGGETVNPALEAVRLLPDSAGGMPIRRLRLPTSFRRAGETLLEAVDAWRPEAVVCVGQAGGRKTVTPEKVAINYIDARIPDNDGAQPADVPIRADGPAAYFATLPVRAIDEAIRAAGVPCAVSYSAGCYVCNFVMYTLLDHLAQTAPDVLGGFIHVPYAAEQTAGKPAGTPSLTVAQMTQALTCAAGVIAAVCQKGRSVI